MKILHTADIHLGDLAGPTKDGRNVRRQDTIACMNHIVEVAQDERPNVSIVAGDLFNRSRVWADTALDDVNDAITEFIRPLCLYSDYVVILFGTENHDNPRAFESIKELTSGLPTLRIYTTPTVETLYTEAGEVQIAALPGFDRGRLRLFTVGADLETENRNATTLINDVALGLAAQLDKRKPSVFVAHYTVSGAEADNGSTFLAGQDVVILPATIDMMGVDLACFGHIHKPQRLLCNTPAYYSGSPNQLNFNDEGIEHGFYIHELQCGGADDLVLTEHKCRFILTPERRHITLQLRPEDIASFITAGTLESFPADITDAIVRVRYRCTAEQDKALNCAELQKQIMAAGAFYVPEVLPEDVDDLGATTEITEHDGPAETLARWLMINNITGVDAERLTELALPIIKKADDGRDTNKHTGAFIPLSVEVKNYRSYTEASFDFEPVHMAMVNGSNGVGKSSLFMDAIADCLFEETRKEDIGGWVRDGTKSGAVTFSFLMGGQTYRAVRTRTKTGRGTLALHRLNTETQEWEDESDTTMRDTQGKIERLLSMDCKTFCSIALIRQDAYGLFLEASSDRRMEVLSALLGLDIYVRMESIARDLATDQRRMNAAAQERIGILGEQIAAKDKLLQDDEELVKRDALARSDLSSVVTALESAQRADTMRQEIIRQADEKQREGEEYSRLATLRQAEAEEMQGRLDAAQRDAEMLPSAQRAADAVEYARKVLEEIAPQVETLRSLHQRHDALSIEIPKDEQVCSNIESDIAGFDAILARRDEITVAQRDLEKLQKQKAEAEDRRVKWDELSQKAAEAKRTADSFLADSRVHISTLEAQISAAEKKAALLDNSGCPSPDQASCNFLADAVKARDELPGLREQLSEMKAADRDEYNRLAAIHTQAAADADALGIPAAVLNAITSKERALRPIADMAAKLEAAEASVSTLKKQLEGITARLNNSYVERADISEQITALAPVSERAVAARTAILTHEPLAGKLSHYAAAEATAEALAPQAERLRQEADDLSSKRIAAFTEADRIRNSIPSFDYTNLAALQERRRQHEDEITRFAGERGGIKAKLETIAEAERQAAEKRAEVEQIARTLNDYTTLAQAFGLDGIQYMIIRGIVPEIMRRANDILAAMTGGRMAVDIRTEKEQKSSQKIVNSLEVWITSITGGSRPYLSHSGGEKVKIALAVTLSLADVKARRAGVQLGMLFIDEPPFLDADGTEAYADALTTMGARNPGMRILAISHDPTMKARFSQNIVVTGGETGSTVTMES